MFIPLLYYPNVVVHYHIMYVKCQPHKECSKPGGHIKKYTQNINAIAMKKGKWNQCYYMYITAKVQVSGVTMKLSTKHAAIHKERRQLI